MSGDSWPGLPTPPGLPPQQPWLPPPPELAPPSGGADAIQYFAYGADMHMAYMSRLCPSSRFIGRAELGSFRWHINALGRADLVASPRAHVPGLVFEISADDLARLDANRFPRFRVDVVTVELTPAPFCLYRRPAAWIAQRGGPEAVLENAIKMGRSNDVRSPLSREHVRVIRSDLGAADGRPDPSYAELLWLGANDAMALGVDMFFFRRIMAPFFPGHTLPHMRIMENQASAWRPKQNAVAAMATADGTATKDLPAQNVVVGGVGRPTAEFQDTAQTITKGAQTLTMAPRPEDTAAAKASMPDARLPGGSGSSETKSETGADDMAGLTKSQSETGADDTTAGLTKSQSEDLPAAHPSAHHGGLQLGLDQTNINRMYSFFRGQTAAEMEDDDAAETEPAEVAQPPSPGTPHVSASRRVTGLQESMVVDTAVEKDDDKDDDEEEDSDDSDSDSDSDSNSDSDSDAGSDSPAAERPMTRYQLFLQRAAKEPYFAGRPWVPKNQETAKTKTKTKTKTETKRDKHLANGDGSAAGEASEQQRRLSL